MDFLYDMQMCEKFSQVSTLWSGFLLKLNGKDVGKLEVYNIW